MFTYSEVFDANPAILLPHVKKTINPGDPGRIGGNRDTLDFKLYFALKDNLEQTGVNGAWQRIKDAALDMSDDGLHNGSAGVTFTHNHDVFKPFALEHVAQAYTLMMPGNTVVYFNGREFGDNRDFPKPGRGDALERRPRQPADAPPRRPHVARPRQLRRTVGRDRRPVRVRARRLGARAAVQPRRRRLRLADADERRVPAGTDPHRAHRQCRRPRRQSRCAAATGTSRR